MKELVLALQLFGNYQEEVTKAFQHAITLQEEQAHTTRYVSFAWIPAEHRARFKNVIDFHFNSLSKKPMIHYGIRVTDTLYAYDLFKYGINPAIYDRLAERNVYFNTVEVVNKQWSAGVDINGKAYPAGIYATNVYKPNKFLNFREFDQLRLLLKSDVPIVRAGFLLHETGIQFNRNGHGYYDLLELKDRDAYLKLVGASLDGKDTKKAMVRKSGVGIQPRQIEIIPAKNGNAYRTLDTLLDDRNERNALNNLNDDFKHEAEEWYGRLPNKLFAYFLSDAKGDRQDYAPPEIGGDKMTVSNDHRIHVGLSCIRCHIEGIRPVDNLLPQLFKDSVKLNTNDLKLADQLQGTYLYDFNRQIRLDQLIYEDDIKTFFRVTPKQLAKDYADLWNWYENIDLLPKDMAFEFGITEERYVAALKIAYKMNKFNNIVLSCHIQDPPIPISRSQAEQLIQLISDILQLTN